MLRIWTGHTLSSVPPSKSPVFCRTQLARYLIGLGAWYPIAGSDLRAPVTKSAVALPPETESRDARNPNSAHLPNADGVDAVQSRQARI